MVTDYRKGLEQKQQKRVPTAADLRKRKRECLLESNMTASERSTQSRIVRDLTLAAEQGKDLQTHVRKDDMTPRIRSWLKRDGYSFHPVTRGHGRFRISVPHDRDADYDIPWSYTEEEAYRDKTKTKKPKLEEERRTAKR